jgi:hypothetical protein
MAHLSYIRVLVGVSIVATEFGNRKFVYRCQP